MSGPLRLTVCGPSKTHTAIRDVSQALALIFLAEDQPHDAINQMAEAVQRRIFARKLQVLADGSYAGVLAVKINSLSMLDIKLKFLRVAGIPKLNKTHDLFSRFSGRLAPAVQQGAKFFRTFYLS